MGCFLLLWWFLFDEPLYVDVTACLQLARTDITIILLSFPCIMGKIFNPVSWKLRLKPVYPFLLWQVLNAYAFYQYRIFISLVLYSYGPIHDHPWRVYHLEDSFNSSSTQSCTNDLTDPCLLASNLLLFRCWSSSWCI